MVCYEVVDANETYTYVYRQQAQESSEIHEYFSKTRRGGLWIGGESVFP